MYSLILMSLLSSAFYYLGSRAAITQWLWSRYPKPFARFMDCPACSGFWYGVLIAIAFVLCKRDLPLDLTSDPLSIVVCGWISIFLTPIGAAVLAEALHANGSAVEAPDA